MYGHTLKPLPSARYGETTPLVLGELHVCRHCSAVYWVDDEADEASEEG